MPLRDKTGPSGQGPRTGRGVGVCEPPPAKKTKKTPKQLADEVVGKGK